MNDFTLKFEGDFLLELHKGMLAQWFKSKGAVNIAEIKRVDIPPLYRTLRVPRVDPIESKHTAKEVAFIFNAEKDDYYFEIFNGTAWDLVNNIQYAPIEQVEQVVFIDPIFRDWQVVFRLKHSMHERHPLEITTIKKTPKSHWGNPFKYQAEPYSVGIDLNRMRFIIPRNPRRLWSDWGVITDNPVAESYFGIELDLTVGVYNLTMYYSIIGWNFVGVGNEP